ncbi:MAG: hypothetical protein WC314_21030 [Vulcanimicrobiota bacterium]
MNIQATAVRPNITRPQVQQQTIQQEAPQAQESVTFSGGNGVGWGDAAVGLVTGVATGAVTGVGAGLSAVKHSALGTVEAYKALWTNETIGPVLKTAMGALLPVATVGVPILSALGGAAYGLYAGFVEGATNGMAAGLSKGLKDVSKFENELAPSVRRGIQEFGESKLGEGEQAFDISPVRGLAAVGAGLGNTVVGGVGIGLSTASQIPEAFITANRAIHQSDMGMPLKTVSHAVSLPLAVLAAPLGVVGGALFGLGAGAYHGYNDGFVESFQKNVEYVGEYHKMVDDGLAKMAEELVKDPRT